MNQPEPSTVILFILSRKRRFVTHDVYISNMQTQETPCDMYIRDPTATPRAECRDVPSESDSRPAPTTVCTLSYVVLLPRPHNVCLRLR